MVFHHFNLIICGVVEMFGPDSNSKFWAYFYLGLYPGDTMCNFFMSMSLMGVFFYQAGRLSVIQGDGIDD